MLRQEHMSAAKWHDGASYSGFYCVSRFVNHQCDEPSIYKSVKLFTHNNYFVDKVIRPQLLLLLAIAAWCNTVQTTVIVFPSFTSCGENSLKIKLQKAKINVTCPFSIEDTKGNAPMKSTNVFIVEGNPELTYSKLFSIYPCAWSLKASHGLACNTTPFS